MTVLRVSGFEGANQLVYPTMLPDTVGANSVNQKPGTPDLRSWRKGLAVASVPANTKTIYRAGRDITTDTQYWLAWPSTVHVTRGFEPDGSEELTYYTGDGYPKWTKLADLNTRRPLGVPAPPTKPYVVQVALAESQAVLDPANWKTYRQYVYTWVNSRGWESQASPVSDLVGDHGTPYNNHTVGSFSTPPSGYDITALRIYMLKGDLNGGAGFYFVHEQPVSPSTTWTHVYAQSNYAGEELPSARWAVPPANLHSLTPMWNGMLAGISQGAVRFCEAYQPYSWPLNYDVLPADSTPVALAVFGQNLLVLTTGRPLLVAGSSPDSLDSQLLEIPQSCVAPRSVVSLGIGVAWASNDGLCWYGQDGARLVTEGILTRDQWMLMQPSSMIGCRYENMYFGSYIPYGETERKGFVIELFNTRGIYFLDKGYEAMYYDQLQDSLFVVDGVSVMKWDYDAEWMDASFTSKIFALPKETEAFKYMQVTGNPTTSASVQVTAYFETEAEAAAVAANSRAWIAHVAGTAQVSYVVNFPTCNGKAVRVPSGFRAKDWQLVVTTDGQVQSVALAHSLEELAQVP